MLAIEKKNTMNPLLGKIDSQNLKNIIKLFNTNPSQALNNSYREFGKDLTNSTLTEIQDKNLGKPCQKKQSDNLLKKYNSLIKQEEQLKDELIKNEIKTERLRKSTTAVNDKSRPAKSALPLNESNVIVNNDIIAKAIEDSKMKIEDQTEVKENQDTEMKKEETVSLPKILEDIEMNNSFENELKEKPKDPQLVEEYFDDILEYHKEMETKFKSKVTDFSKIQKDVTNRMREILHDWLVEVHLKYRMTPEALYLTINLIDRYLEKKQVRRSKYQLLGVSAMLIASKYEDIYPPEIKDFVYITDYAYTRDEVKEMESDILNTLEYNVTISSQYRFLECYKRLLDLDDTTFFQAQYFLETALVDAEMNKFKYSLLAAAAVYLSAKINKIGACNIMVTGYKEKEIIEVAKQYIYLMVHPKKDLGGVKRKFESEKFNKVGAKNFS